MELTLLCHCWEFRSSTDVENQLRQLTLADTIIGQLRRQARDQTGQEIFCMKLRDVGGAM